METIILGRTARTSKAKITYALTGLTITVAMSGTIIRTVEQAFCSTHGLKKNVEWNKAITSWGWDNRRRLEATYWAGEAKVILTVR